MQLIWHDIKIFKEHAFIVSESVGHGMKVFDLTRLCSATEAQTWLSYDKVAYSHQGWFTEDHTAGPRVTDTDRLAEVSWMSARASTPSRRTTRRRSAGPGRPIRTSSPAPSP